MTNQQINKILQKHKLYKTNGCLNEALLNVYHLNVSLIVFIVKTSIPAYSIESKKLKNISKDFLEEVNSHPHLKSIITKKTVKSIKVWLDNMDAYFKVLRLKQPPQTNSLLTETEHILTLLNFSHKKLLAKKSK